MRLTLFIWLLLVRTSFTEAFFVVGPDVLVRSWYGPRAIGVRLAATPNKSSSSPSRSNASTTNARQNRVSKLLEWANDQNIQCSTKISLQSMDLVSTNVKGLGWVAQDDLKPNSLLLTVPTNIALAVETATKTKEGDVPWYVQFTSLLLQLSSTSESYQPWLESLPRDLATPIHWNPSDIDQLQYDYMKNAVESQEHQWKMYYNQQRQSSSSSSSTWEDFLWACETARSRALSGYSGDAFNPSIYAFTLLLVTLYVGLGLGSLESAANGAGLVLAVSIFKDFVLPKLFQKQRYVICPLIDMANHRSVSPNAVVSFEFFGNAYSLAVAPGSSVKKNEELFISYGDRSNDQLLQYYGFVEPDNPNDVYVMPALREWNIEALEQACGRTFAPGRLQKLDQAGLLGSSTDGTEDIDEAAANRGGGVVVTRTSGIDPAVLQALRALVSTEEEWNAAGEAIGNFSVKNSPENERCARLAARTALEMELASKPTTLSQDKEILKKMENIKSMDSSTSEKLAIQFRIEKKKILEETIEKLK